MIKCALFYTAIEKLALAQVPRGKKSDSVILCKHCSTCIYIYWDSVKTHLRVIYIYSQGLFLEERG